MHGCMNGWSGIFDYKRFLIIIDSRCIFTIINGQMKELIKHKPNATTKWIT